MRNQVNTLINLAIIQVKLNYIDKCNQYIFKSFKSHVVISQDVIITDYLVLTRFWAHLNKP